MPKYSQNTPLHYAVQERQVDRVLELLASGTEPDIRDSRGATPLMVAARWGYGELVEVLIRAGARVDAKDRRNRVEEGGRTALYQVCMVGRFATAKLLLEHGADPDCVTQHGHTPLSSVIAIGGNKEIVRLLLDSGASPNGADRCWEPPVVAAAAANELGLLTELLKRGADPNRIGQSGNTALGCTASRECAEALVQHGAQIDLRNAEGQTPLLRNIKTGSLELLEFYVNAGADVNAKDALGYTPLMLLGDRPRLEVAELLLTGGAYVNLIPVKSCTALDWLLSYRNCSAAVEREAVISYLRAHGAKTAGELK